MDSGESRTMRLEFDRVAVDHGDDLSPLVEAVRGLAHHARRVGLPPERLLVALGHLLEGTQFSAVGTWRRSIVRDRCVRAAIEAYYATDRSTVDSHPGTIEHGAR